MFVNTSICWAVPLTETMGIVLMLSRQTLSLPLLFISHSGNTYWEREAQNSGRIHVPISWRVKKGILRGIMFELTPERWTRHCSAREGHRNEEGSYLEVTSERGTQWCREAWTWLALEELRKASKLEALVPEKQQEKRAGDDQGLQESGEVLEALGRGVM